MSRHSVENGFGMKCLIHAYQSQTPFEHWDGVTNPDLAVFAAARADVVLKKLQIERPFQF